VASRSTSTSSDVRHTEFFDAEGNVIRGLTVFPRFRVTFGANGKSITTVSIAVEHATINPDGSFTIAVTGLQGHLIVGGRPPLAVDVGRIVVFFSEPEDFDPPGSSTSDRFPNSATCWPSRKAETTNSERGGGPSASRPSSRVRHSWNSTRIKAPVLVG